MNGSSDNEILDPLDLIRSPRKPKEAALVEAVIDETAEVSEGSEDGKSSSQCPLTDLISFRAGDEEAEGGR